MNNHSGNARAHILPIDKVETKVPYIILEKNDCVGSVWHQHYDRLHLHTDRAHSALPYFHFPKGTPRYPSRLDLINYLHAYTHHFHLKPRFGQEVSSA